MKKVKLTWKAIDDACIGVCHIFQDRKFDFILGISKGGLIPARICARELNIDKIYSYGMMSYSNIDNKKNFKKDYYQTPAPHVLFEKNVLVVDDICDSGETFKTINNEFSRDCNLTFVSLYFKEQSCFIPYVYYKKVENDTWLVFPWENPK